MPAVGAKELAELLDRHAAALELYAASWTSRPEDCVQEAFIELAATEERPHHLVAWLYRVVRNRALNALRADRRRTAHERQAADQLRIGSDARNDRLEQEELAALLDELSSEQREIVVLRIWGGLSWQQIAELTETSSSTAQRRFVAVLEILRKRLEPSWEINSACRPS